MIVSVNRQLTIVSVPEAIPLKKIDIQQNFLFLNIPWFTYAGAGVVEPVAGAFVVDGSMHWFGSITFVTL